MASHTAFALAASSVGTAAVKPYGGTGLTVSSKAKPSAAFRRTGSPHFRPRLGAARNGRTTRAEAISDPVEQTAQKDAKQEEVSGCLARGKGSGLRVWSSVHGFRGGATNPQWTQSRHSLPQPRTINEAEPRMRKEHASCDARSGVRGCPSASLRACRFPSSCTNRRKVVSHECARLWVLRKPLRPSPVSPLPRQKADQFFLNLHAPPPKKPKKTG